VTEPAIDEQAEDLAFYDIYGGWDPLLPAEVAELLQGFRHPWWVVGGHAIEAFTGLPRPHEDIDISFFPDALPDLRRQLEPEFHLWSNDGGTFRFLDERNPEPLAPLAQVWMRKNARSPWVMDGVPSPSVDGRWQSKRDQTHVADLDEVTWVDDQGIRYLNPEVVLLFKSKAHRAKDERDLTAAWPLLSTAQRAWLADAVHRQDPHHPWLPRLAGH